MDKAYMTGFKHIRYTRTTSVAEDETCCDYRLSYDKISGDKRKAENYINSLPLFYSAAT